MNKDERAEIYAAMTELDEDDIFKSTTVLSKTNALFTTILLPDGKPIAVPSVEYVQSLEKLLIQLREQLKKHERFFNRIDAKFRTHKSVINGHSNKMNDMDREMKQKIDRRD